MAVTWARWGMLTLVQILLDTLRLAEKERRVLVRHFDELFHRLHRFFELLGELHVLLVLPGVTEGGEAGLERYDSILQVRVEPLYFLGESPHLLGIHYCLRHKLS